MAPPCPASFKNVYSASGGPASSRKLLALLIAAVLALLACQAHAQAQASQSISSQKGDIVVTELLTGLDHPWAIAFLPDDSGALITEQPGHLRLWKGDGKLAEPISGLPQVSPRSPGKSGERRVGREVVRKGQNRG